MKLASIIAAALLATVGAASAQQGDHIMTKGDRVRLLDKVTFCKTYDDLLKLNELRG
jgi:hypothetical protein